MPITNTAKIKRLLTFSLLLVLLSSGSISCTDSQSASALASKSLSLYDRAVKKYEALIAKGANPDKLYYELGSLYYEHGKFLQAEQALKKTERRGAKKLLAMSYYHLGDFRDALETFSRQECPDDECLYYYALTSEKLNLFDNALKIYAKITRDPEFKPLAQEHIEAIQKGTYLNIKDLSPEIAQILSRAPEGKDYPEAGAIILYSDEKIEVTNQGTQVSNLHYLIKILNERGKEEFAEAQVGYDSTYEKVELEFARVIKPDGAVSEVGSRHIRDVSRYMEFPLYSNARAFIISFPEITEGSIIEYKVKVSNNYLINKKDFVLDYPLQAGEPIMSADFTLKCPKNSPLRIKYLNENYNTFKADLKAQVEEKDGSSIYKWHFSNVPQMTPEAHMPPQVEINPAIIISTFNSWQDVYKWWWQLAKDKISADGAIKAEVKRLIEGKMSDKDKARTIYNFCAQHIRYVAVEYGQAGYEPHTAADIFKNRYGDCKDQAILLVAMLREAGLTAYPLLIPTKEDYDLDKDFPSVMFNHSIAAVFLGDEVIFMDTTAETCVFEDLPVADQARHVLLFQDKGFQIKETPLFPAGHNLIKQDVKIKVNDDLSITAEKTNYTYGVYDQAQRYWLLYTQPELIKEALKEKIQEVSIGAKLDKYKIKNLDDLNTPVILSYSFSGPEYFTSAGSLKLLPQLSGIDTSLVASDKRKYTIDFGLLDRKEYLLEIDIPQGYSVKYMPESIKRDSPWMNFKVEYIAKDNKIIFKQNSELKKNIIQNSDYATFKDFYEELGRILKQRIVLERTT
ncbi:MAG: DUF3857 domain-containing protein [Candidatus Omnitrophota bacterium]|jgi:hypothetical protein